MVKEVKEDVGWWRGRKREKEREGKEMEEEDEKKEKEEEERRRRRRKRRTSDGSSGGYSEAPGSTCRCRAACPAEPSCGPCPRGTAGPG